MGIEKDSNREAFEAWFESRYDANFMQFALDFDMYVDKHTQTCWEAWKAAKAQAVPEWISVEDGLPSDGQNIIAFDAIKHCVFKDGEFLQGYIESDTGHEYEEPVEVTHWMAVEAQEPANEEITIRCTNCGLEFESDYDLEQNLIDPETGEIHDGCPTCKTDAYLMDLIKYPD